MKRYVITYSEVYGYEVEVEANSKEEALHKADDIYSMVSDERIVMDGDRYLDDVLEPEIREVA